jgi:metallo-beta-lactamase family protein
VRLHFLGANRQVTGSRYCVEVAGARVMVDCGLFQEREFASRNWDPSPLAASSIDALLVTHAHLDHVGLIPKLVQEGFRGPIYGTRATGRLAELILRDSAKIQVEDAAYKKRRHQKEGRTGPHPEVPLYDDRDVDRALPLFQWQPYEKAFEVLPGISATFREAGHILGSAHVVMDLVEGETKRKLVFSGDVGQRGKPLIRDPHPLEEADYLVLESTYGDREHIDGGDIREQLRDIVNQTVAKGGKLLIPTFAVERAQELMYYLSDLVYADHIPDIPIFLDSPMAVDVTAAFIEFRDCLDQETWDRIRRGSTPLRFPGMRLANTREESQAINRVRGPAIIMATSGMCTAGRIKHHLRQHIDDPSTTILFVGYQANGTLGRQILERNPTVRIHGRQYPVRADVAQIYGFSGHADRAGLIEWVQNIAAPPRQVFLTHGEEQASQALAQTLTERFGWPVAIPAYRTTALLD